MTVEAMSSQHDPSESTCSECEYECKSIGHKDIARDRPRVALAAAIPLSLLLPRTGSPWLLAFRYLLGLIQIWKA
jgi:hypothetical protein